jgi:hypothetical protein
MKNLMKVRISIVVILWLSFLLTGDIQSSAGQALQPQFEKREIGRNLWGQMRAKGTAGKMDIPQVGITIWRLRPSTSHDPIESRDIVQPLPGGPKLECTPERVESETEFALDERLRLTIETLRHGYLYVINRPRFRDGYGDPYLIFPTQRMHGGDNFVEPRRLYQLPDPSDEPNFFEVSRSRARPNELQMSEEFIIIISPEPFQDIPSAPHDRLPLNQAKIDAWIKKYKAPVRRIERGRAGQPITVVEKRATKEAILLGADDPNPQTTFHVAASRNMPMLIIFQLKVRRQ